MNLWETNSYRVLNEDGESILTYEELLRSPLIHQVRSMVPGKGDGSRVGLTLGRTLVTYNPVYLMQNPKKLATFDEMRKSQLENPLQYFSPSGAEARGFINDTTSKICFCVAPNRAGKTATMLVKKLLDIVDSKKDWPIFAEHGVNHRRSLPENVGIASYEWINHKRTLGPEMLKWVPLWECPEYVSILRGGNGRTIAWRDSPLIRVESGGGFHYYAYNQSQTPFESEALFWGWGWDEQPPVEKFVGANERTRNSLVSRHDFSFTPHRVPGQEHATGAGTFLHDIWKGDNLMGYTASRVSRHTIKLIDQKYDTDNLSYAEECLEAFEGGEIFPLGDVPDWVYPEEEKINAYRQHIVNPLRFRDEMARKAGASRIFAHWERQETMLIPEYNEEIHVIDPFPVPIPFATLFRYVDHGRVKPCAAVWGFTPQPGHTMMVNGNLVTFPEDEPVLILYREYYKGGQISVNARNIVAESGNQLSSLPVSGYGVGTYKKWEERFTSEKYHRCKGDTASLSKKVENEEFTIQDLYRFAGLSMGKTTRRALDESINLVRDWMRIDYTRPHLFYPDTMGYTRVYVFSGLVSLRKELNTLVDPDTHGKKRKQDDHATDCMRYMIIDGPVYSEGSSRPDPIQEELDDEPENVRRLSRARDTGY